MTLLQDSLEDKCCGHWISQANRIHICHAVAVEICSEMHGMCAYLADRYQAEHWPGSSRGWCSAGFLLGAPQAEKFVFSRESEKWTGHFALNSYKIGQKQGSVA